VPALRAVEVSAAQCEVSERGAVKPWPAIARHLSGQAIRPPGLANGTLAKRVIAASYSEAAVPTRLGMRGTARLASTTEAVGDVGRRRGQTLHVDWIADHDLTSRTQEPRAVTDVLNRLTTGTLLPNWLHDRQPILPDEGETEALPKHR